MGRRECGADMRSGENSQGRTPTSDVLRTGKGGGWLCGKRVCERSKGPGVKEHKQIKVRLVYLNTSPAANRLSAN